MEGISIKINYTDLSRSTSKDVTRSCLVAQWGQIEALGNGNTGSTNPTTSEYHNGSFRILRCISISFDFITIIKRYKTQTGIYEYRVVTTSDNINIPFYLYFHL